MVTSFDDDGINKIRRIHLIRYNQKFNTCKIVNLDCIQLVAIQVYISASLAVLYQDKEFSI